MSAHNNKKGMMNRHLKLLVYDFQSIIKTFKNIPSLKGQGKKPIVSTCVAESFLDMSRMIQGYFHEFEWLILNYCNRYSNEICIKLPSMGKNKGNLNYPSFTFKNSYSFCWSSWFKILTISILIRQKQKLSILVLGIVGKYRWIFYSKENCLNSQVWWWPCYTVGMFCSLVVWLKSLRSWRKYIQILNQNIKVW